jgi:hypothetical protein
MTMPNPPKGLERTEAWGASASPLGSSSFPSVVETARRSDSSAIIGLLAFFSSHIAWKLWPG